MKHAQKDVANVLKILSSGMARKKFWMPTNWMQNAKKVPASKVKTENIRDRLFINFALIFRCYTKYGLRAEVSFALILFSLLFALLAFCLIFKL
jgi:hypothetical protein